MSVSSTPKALPPADNSASLVVPDHFDIIKSVTGFSQFLLRGLGKAKGEWTLVCLA